MWFQVELPKAVTIAEIQFESGPPGGRAGRAGGRGEGRGGPPPFGSYPLAYQVQVSMDGKSWEKPVAEGAGTGTPTVISFRPVQARFVRITQIGKTENAPAWSVLNFRIYAAGK
jgi:hypothetical protein